MSETLRVITNSKGSGDYVVVYCFGEVIFEGHSIKPHDLFSIIEQTNGCAENLEFHELTDDQMEDWETAIWE